jgi:hypothetical protein
MVLAVRAIEGMWGVPRVAGKLARRFLKPNTASELAGYTKLRATNLTLDLRRKEIEPRMALMGADKKLRF